MPVWCQCHHALHQAWKVSPHIATSSLSTSLQKPGLESRPGARTQESLCDTMFLWEGWRWSGTLPDLVAHDAVWCKGCAQASGYSWLPPQSKCSKHMPRLPPLPSTIVPRHPYPLLIPLQGLGAAESGRGWIHISHQSRCPSLVHGDSAVRAWGRRGSGGGLLEVPGSSDGACT